MYFLFLAHKSYKNVYREILKIFLSNNVWFATSSSGSLLKVLHCDLWPISEVSDPVYSCLSQLFCSKICWRWNTWWRIFLNPLSRAATALHSCTIGMCNIVFLYPYHEMVTGIRRCSCQSVCNSHECNSHKATSLVVFMTHVSRLLASHSVESSSKYLKIENTWKSITTNSNFAAEHRYSCCIFVHHITKQLTNGNKLCIKSQFLAHLVTFVTPCCPSSIVCAYFFFHSNDLSSKNAHWMILGWSPTKVVQTVQLVAVHSTRKT